LCKSDWVEDSTLLPKTEEFREIQTNLIRGRKEIDFDLLCEMDLVLCSDIETVTNRLKDNAKKLWDTAASTVNSKPLILKAGKSGKTTAKQSASAFIENDTRLPFTFDLSMMVPDGREHLSDHVVLQGKKTHFGEILRTNEESRLIEQELLNVDPNRTISTIHTIEVKRYVSLL
jgi:hypothetical protein